LYEPEGFARPGPALAVADAVRTREICSWNLPLTLVRASLGTAFLSGAGSAVVGLRGLWGSGETDLQQTNALVWVMIALSAIGAIITFAFLVYALWKYRDPKVKKRRYG
jgi:hypothetical protein